MELAPAGIQLSFEVTFDRDDLSVGMSVFDVTGVSPVLVLGPSAMASIVGNTYYGKFTPVGGRSYVVFKAVYTDDTFTVLDDNYSQGSESIASQALSGLSAGCEVIGYVTNDEVIGLVEC